jgi:integrase
VQLYGAEGASKTGARTVPLSWPAARLLTGIGAGDVIWTARTAQRGERAAGGPLTTDGLKRAIRRITRRELGQAYGPHVLRHTMATMYIRAGGDLESLRRILGHSDIRTTAHYLHFVTDDLDDKHAAFSPIARAVPR